MIYLDANAMVKLLLDEAESEQLSTFVSYHSDNGSFMISSELSLVEVRRTLIRREANELDHIRADKMLGAYAMLPMAPVLTAAARLPAQHLRSLDAIHLATAMQLGPAITQFVSYDKRLTEHAKKMGLPVNSPGQTA